MPSCFYLDPNRQAVGPHSPEEILQLHAAGGIAPTSMVWLEGTADWVPIADWVARMQPPVPAAPLPPPAPPTPEAVVGESGLRLVAAAPVATLDAPLRLAVAPAPARPEPAAAPGAETGPLRLGPRPERPPSEPVPTPVRAALKPDDVLPAGTVLPKTPLALGYRVALALCGAISLLVPIIYLYVAGSIGWWGVRQTASNLRKTEGLRAGARSTGDAILYGVANYSPAVAGLGLAAFMLTLLFARRSERERPIVLGKSSQPVLFAVIERVCAAVGAPVPQRVEIDCEPNASAALSDGLRGMFDGNLYLRIGLPFVASLNVREFSGVLAHEMAHFSQRNGLLLSVFVRRLNARLAELAWSRTEWDDRLTLAIASGLHVAVALALVLKAGLGLTRLFFKLLVLLNHVIVCALLRQMEYDADRAQARLAGSACFAQTFRRITVLGTVFERYHLRAGFDSARPYDLPQYMVEEMERLRPDEEQRIVEEENEESDKWWSTHPSTAKRVAAAQALAAPGVILAEVPATELFAHYDQLARTVTTDHFAAYESVWALERGALASF